LTVSFAGCHKYTHWSNGNSHRPQSMLHLALCSGCITAYTEVTQNFGSHCTQIPSLLIGPNLDPSAGSL
jgi:hypothetical protein